MKRIATPIVVTIFIAVGCSLEDGTTPGNTAGTGGSNTGGSNLGGSNTGGANVGGANVGGASTGGTNTGGSSLGGSSGIGGTGGGSGGVSGTGGTPGVGGTSGTGGTGEGGTGGEVTGGTGGGGGNLIDLAAEMHGYTILLPCLNSSLNATDRRTCRTNPAATGCPPANQDPVLNGYVVHNETIQFGGEPGTIYNVTLRIQGQVEAKSYQNGTDQEATLNDGFYVGGTPNHSGNAYNVYAMRVSSPRQDYFFNHLRTGNNNNMRHTTFDMDYTATVQIEGGASITMISADANCEAIKNCQDPDVAGQCTPHSVANLDPLILDDLEGGQPYHGQFVGLLVQDVTIAE